MVSGGSSQLPSGPSCFLSKNGLAFSGTALGGQLTMRHTNPRCHDPHLSWQSLRGVPGLQRPLLLEEVQEKDGLVAK